MRRFKFLYRVISIQRSSSSINHIPMKRCIEYELVTFSRFLVRRHHHSCRYSSCISLSSYKTKDLFFSAHIRQSRAEICSKNLVFPPPIHHEDLYTKAAREEQIGVVVAKKTVEYIMKCLMFLFIRGWNTSIFKIIRL